MNKVLYLLCVFLFACGSHKSTERVKRLPSYSVEELKKRDIIAHETPYKARYYSILPYLYYNGRKDFIKGRGDYYSAFHPYYKEVNLSAGFWSEAYEKKNVLIAQVWVEGYDQRNLDTLVIQARSSKHGILKLTPRLRNKYRHSIFEERLFMVEIDLENRRDVVKKVYDDVITVIVNGYKYELLNPELELD